MEKEIWAHSHEQTTVLKLSGLLMWSLIKVCPNKHRINAINLFRNATNQPVSVSFIYLGAFIVIDSQLDRIRVEKTVDIFGTVSKMRTQRNFMVQTDQQYAFLYEVMVEAVQLTGSEVSAHSLYNYVMKLRQTASTTMLSMYLGDQVPRGTMKSNFPQNITALELEFQVIIS